MPVDIKKVCPIFRESFTVGTSTVPTPITGGTAHFAMHATTASTSSTLRSFEANLTTTATQTSSQVEVGRFILTSNVKTGAWANAVYAKIDYSTNGAAHGMAAAGCFEMVPPNSSLSRGALYALDLEFGCGASSTWGSAGPVAFIKFENWGTAAHFSANAFLFHLAGETAAAGALVSANTNTLKVRIDTTSKYLFLSGAQDVISFSASTATALTIGASAQAISAVVDNGTIASESYGIAMTHTGTLASAKNMVGLNVVTTTGGTAGGWASAGYFKLVQGSTKNVNGYYCALELETTNAAANVSDNFVLVLNGGQSGGGRGSHESYIALRDYGSTKQNSLFWVSTDHTVGSNDATVLISSTAAKTHSHSLRIIVGDTPYWIMCTSTAPAA